MAVINDLLKQISDSALRGRLEQEVARLSKNKKFGLVFEEHIPECTPLYGVDIRHGSAVVRKTDRTSNVYTVMKLNGKTAVCRSKASEETEDIPLAELVAVAQFGEPVFPTLEPIDLVENAPSSSLWHTLIEADNYHALQLLEYLYPKQVDCIYIDPPYNTGARDWNYHNDYVDSADSWRHSNNRFLYRDKGKPRLQRYKSKGGQFARTDQYNRTINLQLLRGACCGAVYSQ
jgi:adenine-specific DNA-methyltransferase